VGGKVSRSSGKANDESPSNTREGDRNSLKEGGDGGPKAGAGMEES